MESQSGDNEVLYKELRLDPAQPQSDPIWVYVTSELPNSDKILIVES